MAHITPLFADILSSYIHHVVRELYTDPAVHDGLERVVHSCIVEPGEQEQKPRCHFHN